MHGHTDVSCTMYMNHMNGKSARLAMIDLTWCAQKKVDWSMRQRTHWALTLQLVQRRHPVLAESLCCPGVSATEDWKSDILVQRVKSKGKCQGQTFGTHVSRSFMFAHSWWQLLAPELGKVSKKRAAQYAAVKRSQWGFPKLWVPLDDPF